MRTKEGQELHDSYVAAVAKMLVDKGYSPVYVDLPEKAKPPRIGAYIPDVYAVKTEQFQGIISVSKVYIVEVETEDTQSTTATLLQHLAFRAWCMQNNAVFEEVLAK